MGGAQPGKLRASRPRGREGNTRRGERGNLPPPSARAGRHLQRRGGNFRTHRGRTCSRPGRETRVRARDNSMEALWQVARRPRTSGGRGRSSTSQNKRRRRRDPTPHRAGTYALTAAQRVGPTTIRTRRVRRRCVPTASGWGTPRENVSGTSSPNEGTSSDGALLRWR